MTTTTTALETLRTAEETLRDAMAAYHVAVRAAAKAIKAEGKIQGLYSHEVADMIPGTERMKIAAKEVATEARIIRRELCAAPAEITQWAEEVA